MLKERDQQTNDQPVQIIQDVITNCSQENFPYLPSRDALRQSIKRVRHIDTPAEPLSLENLIIPENMKKTLDNSDFLIKDSTINNNRTLIFTTIANINQLEQSTLWLMDGIFKTVPNIFRQLYTIHGYVGGAKTHELCHLFMYYCQANLKNAIKNCFKI